MARLYLFAEGQTEQTFADTVLKSHLALHGVYMHGPILIAHAHKKHRAHRGGGRNFDAMQNDIVRFLKRDSASDVFFTSMIDFYALSKNFPGTEKAAQYDNDPYRRVGVLEESWRRTRMISDSYPTSSYMNTRLTCLRIFQSFRSFTKMMQQSENCNGLSMQ